MQIRSANLFQLIVVALLLTTTQITRAQQSSGNVARNAATDDGCRTPVVVTGAVIAPVRIELRRRARLNEVITIAGGFTERAKKSVEIRRAGLNLNCDRRAPDELNKEPGSVEVYQIDELIRGVANANPYVQPGDKVTVSEMGVAYVTGNVMTPKPILLSAPTTLTQAIAMAGGVLAESIIERVRIFRGQCAGIVIVDLKAVKKRRAEDVILQPYDIVEVLRKGTHGGKPICQNLVPTAFELPLRIIF